jgi:hypothetical protein
MVLNALGIDPQRLWKGPWRYFSEEKLETCKNIEIIKNDGITFLEFCCISRMNGAQVEKFLASESSKEVFRNEIKKSIQSMKTENESHIVVSFDRSILGQTGTGHFSPIGGFNEEKDMVLILDVARFKYPPYWVSIEMLWESFLSIDNQSGTTRGFAKLSKSIASCSILCHITNKYRAEWKELVLESSKNHLTSNFKLKDFSVNISNLIDNISETIPQFNQQSICKSHLSLIENFYQETKQIEFFDHLKEQKEKIILICLYLISTPIDSFFAFPNSFKEELIEFRQKNENLKKLNEEILKVSKEISSFPLCKNCKSIK